MYTMELLKFDLKDKALHLSEAILSSTDPLKKSSTRVMEDCLLIRSLRVFIFQKIQKKYQVV